MVKQPNIIRVKEQNGKIIPAEPDKLKAKMKNIGTSKSDSNNANKTFKQKFSDGMGIAKKKFDGHRNGIFGFFGLGMLGWFIVAVGLGYFEYAQDTTMTIALGIYILAQVGLMGLSFIPCVGIGFSIANIWYFNAELISRLSLTTNWITDLTYYMFLIIGILGYVFFTSLVIFLKIAKDSIIAGISSLGAIAGAEALNEANQIKKSLENEQVGK